MGAAALRPAHDRGASRRARGVAGALRRHLRAAPRTRVAGPPTGGRGRARCVRGPRRGNRTFAGDRRRRRPGCAAGGERTVAGGTGCVRAPGRAPRHHARRHMGDGARTERRGVGRCGGGARHLRVDEREVAAPADDRPGDFPPGALRLGRRAVAQRATRPLGARARPGVGGAAHARRRPVCGRDSAGDDRAAGRGPGRRSAGNSPHRPARWNGLPRARAPSPRASWIAGWKSPPRTRSGGSPARSTR